MEKSTLAKKAYLLHIRSMSLAQGMRSGSFKSLYHGQGVDFSGVREYFDGDDVRAIDWNVTARMGKAFVKMFEEERELNVFLVIDSSLSMSAGSGRQSRLDTALECASLLTMASFQNASPVGAVVFDQNVSFIRPPKAGRDQVMLLLSQFDKVACSSGGSFLDNALQGADRLLKKRALVMIFSDFRTSGWIDPFSSLCRRHDVVAVRITDPSDEFLPAVGSVPFTDPECGYSVVLPTSSSKFKRMWSDANYHHMEVWQHECIRHGGYPLVINTNNNPLVELTRFFAVREH